MEKKKNIGGIVLVVILFLTVIGLIGYILVDKDIIKLKKEEKEVSEKKETEENISEEEIEELLDKFGFNIKTYSQNIVFNTGYTDAFKRLVALLKIDTKSIEEKKCSDVFDSSLLNENNQYKAEFGVCIEKTKLISYDKVNKIYKELYDENIDKKGLWVGYHFYDFVEKENAFAITECGGCGGTDGPNVHINKVISSELKNNELIIKIKYLHIYPREGMLKGEEVEIINFNNVQLTFPKDMNIEDGIDKITDEILEKHLEQVDTYEVRFVKKNNNYIFKDFIKKLSEN